MNRLTTIEKQKQVSVLLKGAWLHLLKWCSVYLVILKLSALARQLCSAVGNPEMLPPVNLPDGSHAKAGVGRNVDTPRVNLSQAQ
jgi:hypothetical protein